MVNQKINKDWINSVKNASYSRKKKYPFLNPNNVDNYAKKLIK